MTSNVSLHVLLGPIRGKTFSFESHDTFIVGRGRECHAELPKDGFISRHHFLLEINPPQVTVRDLGSLNGTYVNGVKYGGRAPELRPGREPIQVALKNGDEIEVGNTTIRVAVQASPPSVDQPNEHVISSSENNPRTVTESPLLSPTITEAPPLKPPPAHTSPEAGVERAPSTAPPSVTPAREASEGASLGDLIRQAAQAPQQQAEFQIEGYRIVERLGQGGMGVVYKAYRELDELPVAIKIMKSRAAANAEARRRFLREIDSIRALKHENIATFIDMSVMGNTFYFVTDFCNGGNLAEFAVKQGGRLPLSVARPLFLQVLAALAAAHKQGFVHRDLKPANLLLHQEGPQWTVKLGDFGLAKHFEQAGLSGMTVTGAVGGTYDYMPKEQLTDFKNARPHSDVWSLAATFYRLLTGKGPRVFAEGRDPVQVILEDRSVPIRDREPGIPPVLAACIDRALAMDAQERFSDGQQMHDAFTQVL
jgi:pSer/pThr/pTyr-binding forkhead associated (FHA) protein